LLVFIFFLSLFGIALVADSFVGAFFVSTILILLFKFFKSLPLPTPNFST
jgi:hypothetical protein